MSFQEQSKKLFFERTHQPAFAILIVAALVSMGLYCAWKRFQLGPLVDRDELIRQRSMYQVDLNRADWPELVLLPGVGEKLAKAIVAQREQQGGFRSNAEIMQIRGIAEGKFAVLEPYLLPIGDSD